MINYCFLCVIYDIFLNYIIKLARIVELSKVISYIFLTSLKTLTLPLYFFILEKI